MGRRLEGSRADPGLLGGVGFGSAIVLSMLGGCFQPLATDSDSVPPPVSGDSTATVVDAGPVPALPSPFTDADIGLAQSDAQCPYGSALCAELCGSPDCALSDMSIPGLTVTPPIVLADGGTTANPCDDIETQSMQIRTQSCSQCHGPNGSNMAYNWVLNDQALATMSPGNSGPVVIPGNPAGSEMFKRMVAGLYFTDPAYQGTAMGAPNTYGMPPAPGARQAAGPVSAQNSIVTPTSQDVSIIYEWILNCVNGAPDGGASQLPVNDTTSTPDAATSTGTTTPDAGTAHAPGDAGRD
jgi:hypothetical protein